MPFSKKHIIFALVPLTGLVLLLCYHWIFAGFYPNANGTIGHDYAYFFPRLLDGYYWQLNNGAFTAQWFTPALCGGIPAFPNPQSLYFSVPQWLTFVVDPLRAVYATQLLFAAIGFGGFYLLLRHGFHTSRSGALLGGALFLFNGFFAHRMLVGHLTFHAFMLLPLIAFLLVCDNRQASRPRLFSLLLTCSAALLISYWVYSGMVHLILPAVLVLVFTGLLHGVLHGRQVHFWGRLVAAGGLGIIIALPKLGASLAFLGNFERSSYALPGAETIGGLLRLTFEALFLTPADETAKAVMNNMQWTLRRHELEYGVTLIPLLMLVVGAVYVARAPTLRRRVRQIVVTHWSAIGALLLILLIPLALNYYQADWNALLKETPVLGNSSTLIRWLAIYPPVIILLAVLLFEKSTQALRSKNIVSALAIGAVIAISAMTDRDFYTDQPYQPNIITTAYHKASDTRQPPQIKRIFAFADQKGNILLPSFRDDVMTQGASQLFCYEAMFGYRREHLPSKPLRAGRVDQLHNGHFNIKNPACYVYPDENRCLPGDHFAQAQAKQAEAFVSYRPFAFAVPGWQAAANHISRWLLIAIALLWLAYPLLACLKKR